MRWFSESVTISIVSSLIASGIAWCIALFYSNRCQHRKYARFSGEYEGFGFTNIDGRKLQDDPQSQAVIIYDCGNLLSIKVKHDDRNWTGVITMETGNYGTVAWRYQGLLEGQREFGLKRCIFHEDEIYLIGERVEGYSKEVLKKVK